MPARRALSHRGDAIVVGVRACRSPDSDGGWCSGCGSRSRRPRSRRARASASPMMPSDTHSSRSGQLGADGARGAAEVLDVGRARPARAGHHAVAPRAGGRRAPRGRHQLGHRLQAVARDVGGGHRRLRAVAAVLGAEPAARVVQHAELHAAAEVPRAHRVGRPEELGQRRRPARASTPRASAGVERARRRAHAPRADDMPRPARAPGGAP